jgi:rhodanese-related sulfurtransferase
MPFKSIDAKDAAAKIGPDGIATYVDVRTVAEFTEGRPKGRAINVPIEFYHPKTKETHANEAFTLVTQRALDANAPVIVGADAGPRATQAAEQLAGAGFTEIEVLVQGLPGWQEAGLPVTGDNRDGVSYVSLLTPARRAEEEQEF